MGNKEQAEVIGRLKAKAKDRSSNGYDPAKADAQRAARDAGRFTDMRYYGPTSDQLASKSPVRKHKPKTTAIKIQKAATRRFSGKYAGPDKFKGVIPKGYKGSAKGKYFGKDSRKGANYDS